MDPRIRELFDPQPGLTYLDSATYGLPPEPTRRVMHEAIDAWTAGTAYWVDDWDRVAERARNAFGRLIGVPASRVAMLPAMSIASGVIAADLKPGDRVIVPTGEFTSVLFPLLVARERGVIVEEVDPARFLDAIVPGVDLVACTLVQMQTGLTQPIAEIVERVERAGSRLLLDSTQGTPFVRLGGLVDRIDYLLVSGYKHILCPRGVAFFVLRDDHVGSLPPIAANWRAADQPYGRFFGGPLTLAPDAGRHHVSLPWFSWLGAAESLELLVQWQAQGALDEPMDLARALAERLGVPWGGSTLVCPPIADQDRARAVAAEHRIKVSFRGTAIRLSTHVYNDMADVERAIEAFTPIVGAAERVPA